jgi:hypothetical protein
MPAWASPQVASDARGDGPVVADDDEPPHQNWPKARSHDLISFIADVPTESRPSRRHRSPAEAGR